MENIEYTFLILGACWLGFILRMAVERIEERPKLCGDGK